MVLQVNAERSETQPLHAFTTISGNAQHALVVLESTEPEAPAFPILHSDQHTVESVEIKPG